MVLLFSRMRLKTDGLWKNKSSNPARGLLLSIRIEVVVLGFQTA